MTPVTLIVPVAPVPKARARTVTMKDGKRRTYTPETTVAAEETIGDYWRSQFPGRKPWPPEVALVMDVLAVLPRPKSGPGKKRPYPAVRPDADNYVKTVLDSLNTLAYADDGQVVDCRVRKVYGDRPQWAITVSEVEP